MTCNFPSCPSSEQVSKMVFDNIISHECIRKFVKNVFDCDKSGRDSTQCEVEQLLSCGSPEWLQVITRRRRQKNGTVGKCCSGFDFEVRFEFFTENTCEGQKRIQLFFETLQDVMYNVYGDYWIDDLTNPTITLNPDWEPSGNFVSISRSIPIDNRDIIFGTDTYYAYSDC